MVPRKKDGEKGGVNERRKGKVRKRMKKRKNIRFPSILKNGVEQGMGGNTVGLKEKK